MKRISSVLQNDYFAPLRNKAEQMNDITAILHAELNARDMATTQCRAHTFDDGVLRLRADTVAVAFCIRQILPTLRRILNNKGYKVADIEVFHQPPGNRQEPF